ncbi:pyridoxamine 5'-phosphate oxidase [Pontibacter ummariensis]|uniref:Pyridoxine/pyridoxamine 5'-phosphate oxidase n=1 Tax=Pontibacter ummariensis TaxID=1610492 RepID=A0A239BR50_9BACT|nr:pyridoxamine 5'-phosphate oxidase [Pontibacter ummariensis]PRY15662.1 pyridoxamine 5'-phosphate oxidase [Pontibacter ummariensis]SNS10480.1 Pyridoxamine 5'-phosphate oxidase [Pontibacter ummariensis]
MALTHNIADIRKSYSKQELTEDSVANAPVEQFKVWLQEAITAEVEEPTALVLSTVNAAGRPSARVVLLKDVSKDGFTFFTNYQSRKGRELSQNPFASITFFWPALERQVRIEGTVVKVAPEVSDSYFHSRPKGNQIGAWASPQSQVIPGRQVLEEADRAFTQKFAEMPEVPRPDHWGGFQLQPERVEFWQGRPNRLHDRIVYELEGSNWEIKRLAP